jgi:hypothetical protein
MKPRHGPNAGTDEQDRSTPDSMDQADRTNGEGVDPAIELNDEVNDDPAITGVQDGD